MSLGFLKGFIVSFQGSPSLPVSLALSCSLSLLFPVFQPEVWGFIIPSMVHPFDCACIWGWTAGWQEREKINRGSSHPPGSSSDWGRKFPSLRELAAYEPSATGLLGMRPERLEGIKTVPFHMLGALLVSCPAPWAWSRGLLLELFLLAPIPTSGFTAAWIPGQWHWKNVGNSSSAQLWYFDR